jgi:hypothetical protein
MNITVQYQPGATDPWSQAPDKKIRVGSGQTDLNWSIQVVPASAGTIVFATTPPGIEFTGTGNSAWPGTLPAPQGSNWTSSINNTLPSGGKAVSFHYKVNALYTPAGGTQQTVTWDPDVQEDPPNITVA